MIGFLCATPYHVLAAMTMTVGMFKEEQATLILMNHFSGDEELAVRLKKSAIFKDVILYDNNNKTKLNRAKRLFNAFFPSRTMRDLAKKTEFKKFIAFALDFVDLAYIMKHYEKRKIFCEFAFGDDGIGTYVNPYIYVPNRIVKGIAKLTNRSGQIEKVHTIYAYKPKYMIENTQFNTIPILQNADISKKLQALIPQIWPITDCMQADINNSVLYFEQPYDIPESMAWQEKEKEALRMAADILNMKPLVKFHPRSTAQSQWKEFPQLNVRMSYEVLLLQTNCQPKLMLTVNSTALFSAYLIDGISGTACPAIFLESIISDGCDHIKDTLIQLVSKINSAQTEKTVFIPESISAYRQLLEGIAAK